MAELKFQLFRVRFELPAQESLLVKRLKPGQVFENAIRERPSCEVGRGRVWHIGNIDDLDAKGLYFALGRTTKTVLEHYDAGTRDFRVDEFEFAPYTHVIADTDLGLCAIAQKVRLSSTVYGVAGKLAALLSASGVARDQEASVQVLSIDDPREFVKLIRDAHAVSYFSMTFHRPNPVDVEKLVRRPLERFLQQAAGKSGSTTIRGDQLDQGVLADLARATVAEGDEAKAKIQRVKGAKSMMRYSKGTPVVVRKESADTKPQRLSVLGKVRDIYMRIKGEPGWKSET